MLIVMSVKPTLTGELLKVNSALKLMFSVIEDRCSGGQRSSKWGRQHFKPSSRSIGKQTAERLLIYQVLHCFRVVSCLKPILDCFKMLLALETTTNNQEVKRSLNRLWIIYLKIIFARAWPVDLSPSCSTLSVLLNFENTCIPIYKYQWP